jgi:predicted CoA-binding protein
LTQRNSKQEKPMSAAIATAPARTTRAQIDVFLQQKRVALIGMSRDPRDISRALATEFKKRGYKVLPVNPAMTEVDGARCFARVQQIEPAVAAALLTTSPSVTESVVRTGTSTSMVLVIVDIRDSFSLIQS